MKAGPRIRVDGCGSALTPGHGAGVGRREGLYVEECVDYAWIFIKRMMSEQMNEQRQTRTLRALTDRILIRISWI